MQVLFDRTKQAGVFFGNERACMYDYTTTITARGQVVGKLLMDGLLSPEFAKSAGSVTIDLDDEMVNTGRPAPDTRTWLGKLLDMVTGEPSPTIWVKQARAIITAERDEFQSLAQKGRLPAPLVEAFNRANDRLNDRTAARSGWMKLADSVAYGQTAGVLYPLTEQVEPVEGYLGATVTVARYCV